MYQVTLTNDGKDTVIHSPHINDIKLQSGQIKQGINVADGFTFEIMPNNQGYNMIRPLKTLITVVNTKTGKTEFDGRILMPTENMNESGKFAKSFECESELGYLNDSAQRHVEYHDITVKGLLQVIIDNHNADVDTDKQFKVGVVDVDNSTGVLYRYLGYNSTIDEIKDKLLDRLGGELRVRKENGVRYLDYLLEIGEVKQTEIRLAKNLKSISRDIDPTKIITRLIPLGERIESENEEDTDASQARLTIKTVNDGKDYIDDPIAMGLFGVITKSETWDDITQPNILKTRGQQYLRDNNRVKTSYQIDTLDLSLIGLDIDSFDIHNYYPVINPLMEIDEHLRVIGKTTNILEPERSSLDFCDKFMTASEYQYQANKSQKKIVELENTIETQTKKVNQLSKASQQEIQELYELIDNMDNEEVEETLDLIVQQLIQISETINDIGIEIVDLEEEVESLNDFRDLQELINSETETFKAEQELINENIEERLNFLEGDN